MPKKTRTRYPRDVDYFDDGGNRREGCALERNGNLTLIEDHETGAVDWRAPHELGGE